MKKGSFPEKSSNATVRIKLLIHIQLHTVFVIRFRIVVDNFITMQLPKSVYDDE